MALVETSVQKCFSLGKLGYTKPVLQELVKKNPKETPLIEVLAFVTGYKVEANKKNPMQTSIRFEGKFEIIDRATGEEVISSQAFFGGPAESTLKALKDANPDGAVRAPFMATVMKDTSPDPITGYKFGAKFYLDKKDDSDPFKEIRGVFPERPKAIAAPKAK